MQDDILDMISTSEMLGKPVGSDEKHNKSTFPKLLGLDGAKEKAQTLHTEALQALNDFDSNANRLRQISEFFIQRIN